MMRREFLACAAAAPFAASLRGKITKFLEAHRRGEAYGWESDQDPHLSPTFAAVGCYHLLAAEVPMRDKVAAFVRNGYPVPELRRTDRPLWRFDYEQVQTLLWLAENVDGFRDLTRKWTAPAPFTKRYELDANPVFQHQAMAVLCRKLTAVASPEHDQAWRDYFLARRRPDGTFNNTPASDGIGGHVMNTLWGLWACEALGVKPETGPALIKWLQACQLPGGGFTYRPDARLAGVDDVAYTWAAVKALKLRGAAPRDPAACGRYLSGLMTHEGGFMDRAGGRPNPPATYYALDAFSTLGQAPSGSPGKAVSGAPLPKGLEVFTIQVEAPGQGSPRDAVTLAEALGIHIWCAKNSERGWIEEAQRVASERKTRVLFGPGDEEYGTYVKVSGLGTYSHLVDLVAPPGRDFGQRMPKNQFPYPWEEFRDTRIASLKRGAGRMIWQFNENEELTRILLDEACQTGTYAAISSFHFGNENFLNTQPFLQRWYERLPFVALQDAHSAESWWWGDQLIGLRTLFLAKEPTWEGWLEALDRKWVMAVRHDAITNWRTRLAGGSAAVREFARKRESEWSWWDPARPRRPVASLVVLKPGMRFEAGAPATGAALRLRLLANNTTQGAPREPLVELVDLRVDGQRAAPQEVVTKTDRYLLAQAPEGGGNHRAEARVRTLSTGQESTVTASW